MKRFTVILIALSVLFAFSAFAQAPQAKTEHKAKAHKTVSGKITELTDTGLKLAVTVKDKTETMEFILEKAITGFAVGDEVTVAYTVKDGKNVARKVHKPMKKEVAKVAPKAPAAPAK